MQLKQLNKLLLTSMISICTANIAFAQTKQSDITHDIISFEDSAYGETKGYLAKKSATGSKMDVDISEIPQSLSVITKDMISNRNAQSIQNVTSYTAAIVNPYGENGDGRTNYGIIRGIGYIYKSSFLDGLKLLHGGHMIPKIDPYALERVEVLKGPSSVLYGASGPGGLLNLQSKKPSNQATKEIGVSYGSFDNKTIFADINEKINDKVLVRLTSKYKKGDNALDKSTNKSYFFNPSLTYLIDDNTTLDLFTSIAKTQIKGLGMSFSGSKNIINYHNSIINAGGASLNPTLPSQANEINNANLSSEMLIGLPNHEIFEKSHKSIGANFNKSINEDMKFQSAFRFMKMDGQYNFSSPDASRLALLYSDLSNIPMEYVEIDSDLTSFAIDNNLEYKWDTNNTSNTSLFGFDIQDVKVNKRDSDAAKYSFDVLSPNYSQTITVPTTAKLNTETKSRQLGFYAQNHMKVNEKLVISSSLRYDKLKETNTNRLTDSNSSQKDSNLSGRLGLVYLFENGLSPYITYSTSFQSNVGSDKNGKKFEPSLGKQIEIGTKYKPKNMNALFTLAAFKIEQEKNLAKDPSNSSFKIQQGDAEVKGIEFDALMSPSDASNITISLARLRGKETNMANPAYEGRDLGDLPKLTASIWADYTFRKTTIGDLKLGAGIKYIGKNKGISTDYFASGRPQKSFDVDSYTLTDALIATSYKNTDISFNVNNVFDKKARINNNLIQSGETQGRTVSLTMKYKF